MSKQKKKFRPHISKDISRKVTLKILAKCWSRGNRALVDEIKKSSLRNHMRSKHANNAQVEVQRSQSLGGDRRLSSRLDREPEDPLRSVRKKSRKVQFKNMSFLFCHEKPSLYAL